MTESSNTLPESKAQTRYSETENCEVLLLRGLTLTPELKQSQLTLLSGEKVLLPWERYRLGKRDWRELSAKLMRQIVSVCIQDAPLQMPIEILTKFGLQHCLYIGNPEQNEALLRVAIVEETGSLHGLQGARVHETHALDYRDDLGYRMVKN
ncbi:hypothetical protein D3C85_1355030 [compost metagenome]